MVALPERVGSCPGFQLVDLCFSGEYSKAEIKKKLMGHGGAVAFFGTNDLKEIVRRGEEGDIRAKVWMEAFVLNIAKYIASEAADVCGKVDVILLTTPIQTPTLPARGSVSGLRCQCSKDSGSTTRLNMTN